MNKTSNKSKYANVSPIQSMRDILIKAIQSERIADNGTERYSAAEEQLLIEKVDHICRDAD